MSRFSLSRRALLRGAGSVAVGLPLLEIMTEDKTARAADPLTPLRYLVTFCGVAAATDRTGDQHILPRQTGMNYLSDDSLLWTPSDGASPNTHAFKPLVDYDLGGEVTLISNLHIKRGQGPAHWSERWHPPTMRPLLAGLSGNGQFELTSPTSDVIVSESLGQGTLFPHLALRAQPQKYRFSEGGPLAAAGGRMSANADGPIEPFVDPGQVYDQLFGTPLEGNEDAAARSLRERAIVDQVLVRAERLRNRLGVADQLRVDQHLAELRDVELRLASLAEQSSQCEPPAKPSTDFGEEFTEKSGWSNETERARLMNDLLYMAFVCDLNRAASLMYVYASSYSALTPILGRNVTGDIHEITHAAGDADRGTDLAAVWAWCVGHWAYLIDRLRNTPEGTANMLDNTVSVFLTEAGSGVEPGASEELNDNFGAHSGNNMMLLMAGRSGGRLSPKGHIDANKAHPASVLVSAMKSVGVDSPLGEISQEFAGLTA